MYKQDTIAAVATPAGKGGVGIVRVSGVDARRIANSVTGKDLSPRQAVFCDFIDGDGELIDQGIAIYFAGPASFTGEDVLELQGHGGPVVMSLLVNQVISLGARLARPGEFSERAFLNNKLDLAQAEAVADLIDSSTLAAAKGALRSLKGDFSNRINELSAEILRLRMFTEAAIDFPEEEIDFLSDEGLQSGIQSLQQKLSQIRQQSKKGALLRDGLTLVFAGEPNAGKSSLMNRLVGEEASIVTSVPGTTRDVIRQQVSIQGVPIKLVDTAGLRETADVVEKEGVRRAKQEVNAADGLLLLVDLSVSSNWQQAADELLLTLPDIRKVMVVLNKTDLVDQPIEVPESYPHSVAQISAKTGAGLDQLSQTLVDEFAPGIATESPFISRSRHLDVLERAAIHVDQGVEQLNVFAAGELFAEELRLAHESLCEITGEFSSDDLLGEIFSSFCVGK